MREIKFRAWNVEEKCWIKSFYPLFNIIENYQGRHELEGVQGDEDEDLIIEDGDVILCQYTGLKDKNGKDIYEGDVLKYKPYYNLGYEKKYIVGAVEWGETGDSDGYSYGHHYEWICEDCSLADIADGKYKGFSCEIIGNIYENPELLKEINR
jgi:uncharacterized phage protein (TIGR01671 family)